MNNKIIIILIWLLILISYNKEENIVKVEAKEENIKVEVTIDTQTMVEDYKTTIKWWKYNQAVTIYAKQFEEMKARGYSNTRILDLLALKSMECNKYTSCVWYNWNDLWPFQINKIHKEQYNKSVELHNQKRYWELFSYQLSYADSLVQSYMDRYCDWKWSKTNKNRFYCVAVSYNWHPRYKHTYKKIGWEKRKIISDYLFSNWYLIHK